MTYTNPFVNPFAVLQPAGLYGRSQILKLLVDRVIRQRSSLNQQIVGLRGVGKTSLLNVFAQLNNLANLEFIRSFGLSPDQVDDLLFVQVDCDGAADDPASFWRLMGTQLTKAIDGLALRKDTDSAQLVRPDTSVVTYRDLVETLEPQLQAGRKVVFLLDDFDRAAQNLPIEVLVNLRDMSNAPYRAGMFLRIIIATHRPLVAYYRQRGDAIGVASPSRLLAFFDSPIFLGLLDSAGNDDLDAFIAHESAAAGFMFSAAEKAIAAALGGGHPDLTRRVCRVLFDERSTSGSGAPDRDKIMRTLLPEVRDYFEEVVEQGLDAAQQAALFHIARCQIGQADPRSLNALLEYGLVVRFSGTYRLFSPVLDIVLQGLADRDRVAQAEQPAPEVGAGLTVWREQQTVQVAGSPPVRLTANEWRIFAYLWEHANQVVDRKVLSELLNAAEKKSEDTLVYMTLKRLRSKIDQGEDGPGLIQTVHGQGYVLRMPTTYA